MEMNGNALLGGRRQARRASRAEPGGSAKATRERFTPQYGLSIVERMDACETSGEIGRLPRREGLYSSHLSAYRKAARVELGIRRSTFCGWYRRHKDKGRGGLADRHSGAGVHWNGILDTVRQRVVDPADEVRTGAS